MSKKVSFTLSTALLVLACSAAWASPIVSGDAAYKAGRFTEALADFKQAVAQTSGAAQAKAYYREGLAYHKMRDDAQAIAAYRSARAVDPSLSFASSPSSFNRNVKFAQDRASKSVAAPPGAAPNSSPTSDQAALALANGDVYVAPGIASQVDQTQLTDAANSDDQIQVKIAVLDRLPPGYTATTVYARRLHDYLNLGSGGLIVVALHGPGAGVAGVAKGLSDSQERAIAQKYVAQIGAGNYTASLVAMAHDLASTAASAYWAPIVTMTWIVVIIVLIILAIVIVRGRGTRAEITKLRVPILKERDSIIAGIEQLDNYIDVLPKNNADSDQVRAFRQAAAYKVEQAEKVSARATEVSDMYRAQNLLDQAGGDVDNGRKYLDRATGGLGVVTDGEVKPIPFPASQKQVNEVPDDARGVSFFSSQPASLSSLVPISLNVEGEQRTVMATPQEAEQVRTGQTPAVRSFNVGGQHVPWYGYQQYDPYRDYWTYQNNGWRGIAGGAIAGFIGAELMGSLFSPQPYWAGGWNSPYAYGPGWDTWGGWNDYGGGFGQSLWSGGQTAGSEQDSAFQDPSGAPLQDPNYDGGASFMNSNDTYDTSDYGSGGDNGFMGDSS